MDACAVIGLGNPGPRYQGTRHNLGFMVLEEVGSRWGAQFKPGKGSYELARVQAEKAGRDTLLVAPLTWMNNSGEAAADIVERFLLAPSSVLVVLDDFWLPLGKIRFRPGGSDGGHNGLSSVIGALNTDMVPRLRLGIGKPVMPPKAMMADFVLSRFDSDELPTAKEMVSRAADAVVEFARTGKAAPKNPLP